MEYGNRGSELRNLSICRRCHLHAVRISDLCIADDRQLTWKFSFTSVAPRLIHGPALTEHSQQSSLKPTLPLVLPRSGGLAKLLCRSTDTQSLMHPIGPFPSTSPTLGGGNTRPWNDGFLSPWAPAGDFITLFPGAEIG